MKDEIQAANIDSIRRRAGFIAGGLQQPGEPVAVRHQS